MKWEDDHAASGWRARAWPENGGEIIAYESGEWLVCVFGRYDASAQGQEKDQAAAKARAVAVYAALTGPRSTGSAGSR